MIRVTAGVLRQGNCVLLARRPPGGHLAGHWELPGGKLEDGESPEACLARELLEELGVQVRVGQLVATGEHHYEHLSIELLVYEASVVAGTPRAHEHDALAWVAIDRLLDYELAPADVPIVELLTCREGGTHAD